MSGDCISFENPIEDAISKLRFSPESNNLLVSSWDSNLRLYDVENSHLRFEFPSEAALLDCCFENDSACFSTGSDGLVRRYDLNAGTVDAIGKHSDVATCIRYSAEKSQAISVGLDGKIRFWDSRQEKSLVFVINVGADVGCISVSGFDFIVCIGATIHGYDLRNLQQPFQSRSSPVDVPIRCVSSIPYSRGYAVGSIDGRVALDVLDPLCSSEMKYAFRCHPKSRNGRFHFASVNEIEFSPRLSETFVTGDNEGFVITWDAQSRRKLFELPIYPNSIASLAFNCTGELLAIASSNTYQESKEKEEAPQIFIQRFDRLLAHADSGK